MSIKFGEVVVSINDLPRADGLIFVKGHEFTVMETVEIEGQILCDLQDKNFERLHWVRQELLMLKSDLPMGSMILLNESGDIEIIWSDEHEESMRELIEKKLKEGYSFFILEKKFWGLVECKEKVISMDQIQKGSKLLLRDEDAVRLFNDGKIKVKKSKEKRELNTTKRSKDVDEILKSDTVAVRPVAGG